MPCELFLATIGYIPFAPFSLPVFVQDHVARAEQHISGIRRHLEEQQQQEGHQRRHKITFKLVVQTKVDILEGVDVVSAADTGGGKQASEEARSGGGGGESGNGERAESGAVDQSTGEFDAIVNGVKSGQLRALLIRKIRATKWGALGHTCARVRMATLSMGGLQEVEVLGEGSFGVVSATRHSTLGGSFAIKKLKEVRGGRSLVVVVVDGGGVTERKEAEKHRRTDGT